MVYVDDIVITRNDPIAVSNLRTFLNNAQFQLKDLGSFKYFLGLEINRRAKGISVCQRKYALEILNDCGLLTSKPTKFLVEPNVKLSCTEGVLLGRFYVLAIED